MSVPIQKTEDMLAHKLFSSVELLSRRSFHYKGLQETEEVNLPSLSATEHVQLHGQFLQVIFTHRMPFVHHCVDALQS
eukprot:Skav221705  [mRNA]  locus=scaffold542:11823:14549:+ [translate_table: standard]